MDDWLTQLGQAWRTRDARAFAALTRPPQPGSASASASLSLAAASSSSSTTSSFISQRTKVPPPVADFLYSYISLCTAPVSQLKSRDDADSARAWLDLARACFMAFALPDGATVSLALSAFVSTLVSASLSYGRLSGDRQLGEARQVANLLTRPLLVASNDRAPGNGGKRAVLFHVANQAFRIYFAIDKLRLCDTVLKYTRPWLDLVDQPGALSNRDMCTFFYYRGRFFLYQRQLQSACADLARAFALCPTWSPRNARTILIYLAAANIPLGRMPERALLREFSLERELGPLVESTRQGRFTHVLAALDAQRAWLLRHGIYLLLRDKLELVCWRNLARKTLYVATDAKPQPAAGPPQLSLHALLATAKVAFPDPLLDIDDVECVCATLIEQGYLKAYVMHSMRLLVLQKAHPFGFPPVAAVYPPAQRAL